MALSSVPISYEGYCSWRGSFEPETPNISPAGAQIMFKITWNVMTAYQVMYMSGLNGDRFDEVYEWVAARKVSILNRHDPRSFEALFGISASAAKGNIKPVLITCPRCGRLVFMSREYERGHKDECPLREGREGDDV
jgi:ribosomal protein S27AE